MASGSLPHGGSLVRGALRVPDPGDGHALGSERRMFLSLRRLADSIERRKCPARLIGHAGRDRHTARRHVAREAPSLTLLGSTVLGESCAPVLEPALASLSGWRTVGSSQPHDPSGVLTFGSLPDGRPEASSPRYQSHRVPSPSRVVFLTHLQMALVLPSVFAP